MSIRDQMKVRRIDVKRISRRIKSEKQGLHGEVGLVTVKVVTLHAVVDREGKNHHPHVEETQPVPQEADNPDQVIPANQEEATPAQKETAKANPLQIEEAANSKSMMTNVSSCFLVRKSFSKILTPIKSVPPYKISEYSQSTPESAKIMNINSH